MLIQLRIAPATLPRTGEAIAFVRGEIGPKVTALNGSRGFLMALDHTSGAYVAMAAWSDRATLETHDDLVSELVAEATRHLHSGESAIEVFDLAVSLIVKPLRIGYWGRLVRIQVPAAESDRAAQRFRDTFVPGHDGDDGLAAISLLLNPDTGAGFAASWYDSLPRLRGMQQRGEESGQLLISGEPAFTAIERRELHVVITEPPPPSSARGDEPEFLTSYP